MNRPTSQPTVLVTGAATGIGRGLALELSCRGAGVVVHGRTASQIAPVAADLERRCQRPVPTVVADLASVTEVRVMADQVRARFPQLSVLVHASSQHSSAFVVVDGHEETFAVNHLASVLLTHELYGTLAGNENPRVVFLSDTAHAWGEIHWDDISGYSWYDPERAYAQSRLATLLTLGELARRTPFGPVTALAVNPGLTRAGRSPWGSAVTAAVARLWLPFIRRPVTVSRELARVCEHPSFRHAHGAYLSRGIITEPAVRATDPRAQARMWDLTAQLIGVDPDWPARFTPSGRG